MKIKATTTIKSREELYDEFVDLINSDPDFNYSIYEFNEWLKDYCNISTNTRKDIRFELEQLISEILDLVNARDDMSTSDLQGALDVIVAKIYKLGKEN